MNARGNGRGKTFREWMADRPSGSARVPHPPSSQRVFSLTSEEEGRPGWDDVEGVVPSPSGGKPLLPTHYIHQRSFADRQHLPQKATHRLSSPGTEKDELPPVAGEKAVAMTAAKWRSMALFHEVKLKELLADECRAPNAKRLEKVLEHYDMVADYFPTFKCVFGLIKSELVTSIYASSVATNGEVEKVPYFESLASVLREVQYLREEINAIQQEAKQDVLRFQVDSLTGQNQYLTHQVDRLKQENESLLEDVTKLTLENEAITKNGRLAFSNLEKQFRQVQTEHRQLGIKHAQLLHDMHQQKSTLAEYQYCRSEQFELQAMFSRNLQQATVLQLLLQLEAAENHQLDSFDNSIDGLPAEEITPIRTKFVSKIRVLLAELECLERFEMHLGNAEDAKGKLRHGVRALTERSEVVTVDDSDSDKETKEGAYPPSTRGTAKMRSLETPSIATHTRKSSTVATNFSETPATATLLRPFSLPPDIPEGVQSAAFDYSSHSESDKERFIDELMNKGLAGATHESLFTAVSELPEIIEAADPTDAMQMKLTVPLMDVDPLKFEGKIELHTSTSSQHPPEHFKTVVFVDPTVTYELPPKASHLQLRYQQPSHALAKTNLETLPAVQQESFAVRNMRKVDVSSVCSQAFSEHEASCKRDAASSIVASFSGAHDASRQAWEVYKANLGSWFPRLPRVLPLALLEEVISHTYHIHTNAMALVHAEATRKRPTVKGEKIDHDKVFRDRLKPRDLLDALLQVLERRYSVPEVVMKAACEIITSCEKHNSPTSENVVQFLAGLGGNHDVGHGKVLSLVLTLLDHRWPLSRVQENEVVGQKDLATVLEGMYPHAEGHLNEIISDLAIHTKAHFTLSSLRNYFIYSITARQEHTVKRVLDALYAKTSTLHCGELDRFDFVDACLLSTAVFFNSDRGKVQDILMRRHLEACARLGSRTRLKPDVLCMIAAEVTWEQVASRCGGWPASPRRR